MIITPFNPDREARKCGTEVPHEPTDEFVRQAFGSGARALWPDARDPGWYITFDRWLAEHVAAARREALLEAADEMEAEKTMPFWSVHVASLRKRAALAEPERDEESGR